MKRSFSIERSDLVLPKLLVGSWGLWFIAAAVLPFTYEGGSWFTAGFISLAYVLVTGVTALVLACAMSPRFRIPLRRLQSTVRVRPYALLGLVGAGFLIYDRLAVQHVDLSAGIASARTEWAALGEQRVGISSPYSVLGNLLWAFAYVPLAYGYLYYESLRAGRKGPLLSITFGIMGIVGVSALNGGRMPIVFGLAVVVCTSLIRVVHGMPMIPRFSLSARLMFTIGLVAVGVYVPFVLVDRAAANSTALPEYTESSVSYLRGKPKESWAENPHPNDVVAVASLSVAQLVHPFWLLEVVKDDDHREGAPMLVSTPLFLFQKLGFFRGTINTWTYSGLYLSLPGAAFHDAGWLGFALMALLHGVGLAWGGRLVRRITPFTLVILLAIGVVTVLSPMVPAFLAGPFPFMLVALMVPALRLRRIPHRWARRLPVVSPHSDNIPTL